MATILLVDDNQTLRDMYSLRFVRAGHTVYQAVDGVEALEKVKSIRPDVVLLDVMMPKMNGLDVLKVLKDDASTVDVPVIMITAIAEDLSTMVAGRAAGYIQKTEVHPDQVVTMVEAILVPRTTAP